MIKRLLFAGTSCEKSAGSPIRKFRSSRQLCFLDLFIQKNQVLLFFKLTLNMTIHPVMTPIGVNIHCVLNK